MDYLNHAKYWKPITNFTCTSECKAGSRNARKSWQSCCVLGVYWPQYFSITVWKKKDISFKIYNNRVITEFTCNNYTYNQCWA